jgi:hypothetical protein
MTRLAFIPGSSLFFFNKGCRPACQKRCGQNSYLDLSKCQCRCLDENTMVACDNGCMPKCNKKCPKDSYLDAGNCICRCNSGFVPYEYVESSDNSLPNVSDYGEWTPVPSLFKYKYFDFYFKSGCRPRCDKLCPIFSTLDPYKCACVCQAGYIPSGFLSIFCNPDLTHLNKSSHSHRMWANLSMQA